MKIDLTGLFNGSELNKTVKHTVDLSDMLYGTYCPIRKPVSVQGRIFSKADVVYLELDINYTLNGYCDRCADEVKKDYSIKVRKILVQSLQNEDDDDNYIIIDNQTLDLNELVSEEVSLNLPSKLLCSDNCKGLCPKCGTNLNVNKCDCKGDVDPRMAALLQLLDEE